MGKEQYDSMVKLFTSMSRDFQSTVKFIASMDDEYCELSTSKGEEKLMYARVNLLELCQILSASFHVQYKVTSSQVWISQIIHKPVKLSIFFH